MKPSWAKGLGLLLAAAAQLAGARAAPPPPDPGPGPAAPAPLRWPLDSPPRLRSSFGEFREGGRVHGGLDLSTGGANGVPVRAMADGEVFRLKVEWRGYGNAVYQRAPDGRILVYAHLQEFSLPALAEAVRQARRSVGRYPGDIEVSPPLRVRAGQVLALSGESGAGFPHLHFEVRSPANEPLEPMQQGLPAIADAEPPAFEALWILAAEPGSWVEGASWARRLQARKLGAGAWQAGPVRVAGAIDLVVEAHDPSPDGGSLGLAGLRVLWDGVEASASRSLKFGFDEARRAAAIHDAERSHLSPTRLAYRPLAPRGSPWLKRDPAHSLSGESGTRHGLEIEAHDASGNRAVLRVSVECVAAADLVRPAALPAAPEAAGPGDASLLPGRVDPRRMVWLDGALGVPLQAAGGPRGRGAPEYRWPISEAGAPLAGALWSGADPDGASEGLFLVLEVPQRGGVRFEPAAGGAALRAMQERASGRALRLELGGVELRVPRQAFPRGTPVTLQERPAPPPPAGLLEVGAAAHVEPAWGVPAAPLVLEFAYDRALPRPERLGAYRWDAVRERWVYAGGAGEARAGRLAVAVGDLGTFRVLEDTAPPQWGASRPGPRQRVPRAGWTASIDLDDEGVGIHWDGAALELDGTPLEAEYDPDRKRLSAPIGRVLAPGAHRLTARARDRAGNEAPPRQWSFQVRARRGGGKAAGDAPRR